MAECQYSFMSELTGVGGDISARPRNMGGGVPGMPDKPGGA